MKTAGSHIGARAITNAEKRIGVWGGRYGPGAATAVSEASPFFLRAFLPLPLSFFPSFIQSLVHSYSLSLSLSLSLSPPPSSLLSRPSLSFLSHLLLHVLSISVLLAFSLHYSPSLPDAGEHSLPSTTQFSTHVSRFQPPPTPPAQSA